MDLTYKVVLMCTHKAKIILMCTRKAKMRQKIAEINPVRALNVSINVYA